MIDSVSLDGSACVCFVRRGGWERMEAFFGFGKIDFFPFFDWSFGICWEAVRLKVHTTGRGWLDFGVILSFGVRLFVILRVICFT